MKRLLASAGVAGLLSLYVVGLGAGSDGASSRVRAEASEDLTFARDGAAGLRVLTTNGAIRATAGDGDAIRIHVVKQARAEDEATARAFLRRITIERRREGGDWVVEAKWPAPRRFHVGSAGAAFEIQVPRDMGLDASSSNGRIEATGVREARLHSSNGAIRAIECAGPLEAETSNGAIAAIRVGDARLHTSNGEITVDAPAGAVDAETSNGHVAVRRAASPVHVRTSNGSIDADLTGVNRPVRIDLTTSNGSIDLRLPQRVSARVEADTSLGRIEMEPTPGARFNRSRTHLDADLGGAEGSVRLHTTHGGIRISLEDQVSQR